MCLLQLRQFLTEPGLFAFSTRKTRSFGGTPRHPCPRTAPTSSPRMRSGLSHLRRHVPVFSVIFCDVTGSKQIQLDPIFAVVRWCVLCRR